MIQFNPIGYLKCDRCYHEEQPRQGNLSDSKGYIELISGHNYEQGLKDLDGFSRIWVIYEFHQSLHRIIVNLLIVYVIMCGIVSILKVRQQSQELRERIKQSMERNVRIK